jgi:hypothetical protein
MRIDTDTARTYVANPERVHSVLRLPFFRIGLLLLGERRRHGVEALWLLLFDVRIQKPVVDIQHVGTAYNVILFPVGQSDLILQRSQLSMTARTCLAAQLWRT